MKAFGVLLGGLLLAASCQPAPGSSCDAGEARCLDAKRGLVCDDGKFVEVPCKGKGGCTTLQQATSCDISGNQPGDACAQSEEGAAVCAEEGAMLVCRSRRFERVACLGPGGCETVGDQPSCDQSIAEAGDVCRAGGAKACAVDKARLLSCKDGRMTELYPCRGDGGCSSAAGKLTCDQTVARLGDGCDERLNGHVACSEDHRALVRCDGARFVAAEKCKVGTVCTVAGQSTRCVKP